MKNIAFLRVLGLSLVSIAVFAPPICAEDPPPCTTTLTDEAKEWLAENPDAVKYSPPPADEWLAPWRKTSAHVLVHMPSGELTAPLPANVSERDTFLLVAVVPAGSTVTWNVKSCDKPPFYRVLTSPAPAAPPPPKNVAPAPPPPPPFSAVWANQGRQCADKLEYEVEIKAPNCTSKQTIVLTTNPVYDFFLGAGFGYNFASPIDWSADTQTVGDTMTTRVIRQRGAIGFQPVFTLSVFPFGADLNSWRWYDSLAPFIAADPTRFDQGAIAGINWSIPSGFGIMTGVGVYKSEELKSTVGYTPCNAGSNACYVVPQGGNADTRNVFNSDGVGFFIGANFTTDVLGRFLKSSGVSIANLTE